MKKTLIAMGLMICLASLTACRASGETSAQSRTDLTADHIRGLSRYETKGRGGFTGPG